MSVEDVVQKCNSCMTSGLMSVEDVVHDIFHTHQYNLQWSFMIFERGCPEIIRPLAWKWSDECGRCRVKNVKVHGSGLMSVEVPVRV